MVKNKKNKYSKTGGKEAASNRLNVNCDKPSKCIDVKLSRPSKHVGYSCLQTGSVNSEENAVPSRTPQYIYYKRNGVLKKRRVVARDKRKVIFLKQFDIKNCYPDPPHNTSSFIMDLHEDGGKCPSHLEHMNELQDAESESNTSDVDEFLSHATAHDQENSDVIELVPYSTLSVWSGDSLVE